MTWEYISGFFDGEGHVSCLLRNKKSTKYQIGMAQTKSQAAVLFVIKDFLEEHGVRVHVHLDNSHNKLSRNTTVRLRLSDAKSVATFIRGVLPFIIVKKGKALVALLESEAVIERSENRKARLAQAVLMRENGSSYNQVFKETRIKHYQLQNYVGSINPDN